MVLIKEVSKAINTAEHLSSFDSKKIINSPLLQSPCAATADMQCPFSPFNTKSLIQEFTVVLLCAFEQYSVHLYSSSRVVLDAEDERRKTARRLSKPRIRLSLNSAPSKARAVTMLYFFSSGLRNSTLTIKSRSDSGDAPKHHITVKQRVLCFQTRMFRAAFQNGSS